MNAACAVCQENNQDDSVKSVFWCELCKAYVCDAHKKAYASRIKAAVKVKARKVVNLIKKSNG